MEVCLGMKKFFFLLALIPFLSGEAFSQENFKIHSHNDYLRNEPFWEAFRAGAASIEVDVILQEGQLMVAHEKESIQKDRTLKSLYLDPIVEAKKLGKVEEFGFHLLIDCKTEAYSTLDQVVNDALDYEEILFSSQNPTGLKLIISGNRPMAEDYVKYPEWVFFDYQNKELTSNLPWEKIGMVSLSFSRFSAWKGTGSLPEEDRKKLEDFIALVHSFQKPVRFWASPDGELAWKTFFDMGVDYINTDQPGRAGQFFND